eukprot:751366-Hanusia_phi.AAC.3
MITEPGEHFCFVLLVSSVRKAQGWGCVGLYTVGVGVVNRTGRRKAMVGVGWEMIENRGVEGLERRREGGGGGARAGGDLADTSRDTSMSSLQQLFAEGLEM